MAHVNGNRYHSFGQGARREKEKAETDSSHDEQGSGHGEAVSSQFQTHIKHDEDSGEYHVKHEGDKKTHKFGSKEEMMNHLDEHYQGGDESEEEMADEEGMGSLGGAVKSLLG
jgi:hypothetical protein